MFTHTRLKLTFLYSLLFLACFWAFSFGLYFWMERSFGEGYISKVKQQTQQGQFQGEFDEQKAIIVTKTTDIALLQLRDILLAINGVALLVIPTLSWYLVKKSLAPVQAAHERQKQFVSDASHELRTPIAIMTGEIEIALHKNRTREEYQKVLKSNKEELTRLTTLVESLLFLARDDQAKNISLKEKIDLTDLLTEVIASLRSSYLRKKLKLVFFPPEANVVVSGNQSLLRQLFFNLLDNAIKYTEKGDVGVKLSQTHKFARIEIADTGRGINEEEQKKLFDRFYRADNVRFKTQGYGLGLAICQAITNRHKGTIRVLSKPEKGSIFTVLLPLG